MPCASSRASASHVVPRSDGAHRSDIHGRRQLSARTTTPFSLCLSFRDAARRQHFVERRIAERRLTAWITVVDNRGEHPDSALPLSPGTTPARPRPLVTPSALAAPASLD